MSVEVVEISLGFAQCLMMIGDDDFSVFETLGYYV